jgi:hypothetical protein
VSANFKLVMRQILSSVPDLLTPLLRLGAEPNLNGPFILRSSKKAQIVPVRRNFLIGVGAFTVALMLPPETYAQSKTKDHERARKAVKSGKILPLKKVLERIAQTKKYPGKVVDADVREILNKKLKRKEWLYFLKVVDKKGRVTDLVVDAKTAKVRQAKRGGPLKKKKG